MAHTTADQVQAIFVYFAVGEYDVSFTGEPICPSLVITNKESTRWPSHWFFLNFVKLKFSYVLKKWRKHTTHYSEIIEKTAILRGKKIEIYNVPYLEAKKRTLCVAELLKALPLGAWGSRFELRKNKIFFYW